MQDDDGNEASPTDEAYQKFLREMEGKSVQDILAEGQKALFIDLVSRVRMGEASHQEKAILRNLLKDNGFTLGIDLGKAINEDRDETRPPMDLPEYGDPDYLN